MPFTRGAGLGFAQAAGAAAETLEQRLRIPTGQFQHAAVGVAGRVGRHGGTSPPRSSMGERRKWRPVRRARAADEKNDFRNVNIGVLRLFVLSRAASGEESRGTAQPRRRTRRGSFSGRHGRQAACLARACARPAGAGRRSAAYGRVQAPEQCCRCPDRVKSAPGAENGKGSERKNRCRRIGRTLGQPGRGFSAAGSVRTRMRLAGRLAGSGRVRQACRRRARAQSRLGV